jgi:hypothetical protein
MRDGRGEVYRPGDRPSLGRTRTDGEMATGGEMAASSHVNFLERSAGHPSTHTPSLQPSHALTSESFATCARRISAIGMAAGTAPVHVVLVTKHAAREEKSTIASTVVFCGVEIS